MTVVFPEGVSAEGNIRVAFVPAIAATSAPKVATEIKGTGAVDISCYITSDFEIAREQNTGEDRRLCSKETFQTLGRTSNSIPMTEYVYYPQAATGEAKNKAYEILKRDVTGFIVVRYGLDARDVDWASAQKVDLVPVRCGTQRKLGAAGGDNEFSKLRIGQMFAVTGPMVEDAVLAA